MYGTEMKDEVKYVHCGYQDFPCSMPILPMLYVQGFCESHQVMTKILLLVPMTIPSVQQGTNLEEMEAKLFYYKLLAQHLATNIRFQV